MNVEERAKRLIRGHPLYSDTRRGGSRWVRNDDNLRVTEDYTIPPLLFATIPTREAATPEFQMHMLCSGGYPRVEKRPEDNTLHLSTAYGALVVPEEGDDLVLLRQDAYSTMCGGQQISITSAGPDNKPDVYRTGWLSPRRIDYGHMDNCASLREGLEDNTIGILTVQVDTRESNSLFVEAWDKIADECADYDDMSYARREYPSPVHAGQTAVIWIFHCRWEEEHDDNKGAGDYDDEVCVHCGDTMSYNEDIDSVWCYDCDSDEWTRGRAEDDDIDDSCQDRRDAWMSGVSDWYHWERGQGYVFDIITNNGRCVTEKPNAEFPTPAFYGGIKDNWASATCACWRTNTMPASMFTILPEVGEIEGPTDTKLLTLGIFNALQYQPEFDNECCFGREETRNSFWAGTTRLRLPIFISCDVGKGTMSTLNIMKNLIENAAYIRSKFCCEVVVPEGVAANPKEGYHYTDSVTLVPCAPDMVDIAQGGTQ